MDSQRDIRKIDHDDADFERDAAAVGEAAAAVASTNKLGPITEAMGTIEALGEHGSPKIIASLPLTTELSGTTEAISFRAIKEGTKTKIVFQEHYPEEVQQPLRVDVEKEEIVFQKQKKEILEEMRPRPSIDLSERRNRIKELK